MVHTSKSLRELALFAGAGGGLLGGLLSGWQTICAVEINDYCRRVLLQRQSDGIFPLFPIWDNIKTFNGAEWKGGIDIVSGGFPCQAFSTAAHGNNTAEDLWPEMFRIVKECTPTWVFAENVAKRAITKAQSDLESIGFKCKWKKYTGNGIGAPHRRQRFWLVGHSDDNGESNGTIYDEACGVQEAKRVAWWDEDSSSSLRMDDGVASRMERIRAIGNGQIPSMGAIAWTELSKSLR